MIILVCLSILRIVFCFTHFLSFPFRLARWPIGHQRLSYIYTPLYPTIYEAQLARYWDIVSAEQGTTSDIAHTGHTTRRVPLTRNRFNSVYVYIYVIPIVLSVHLLPFSSFVTASVHSSHFYYFYFLFIFLFQCFFFFCTTQHFFFFFLLFYTRKRKICEYLINNNCIK